MHGEATKEYDIEQTELLSQIGEKPVWIAAGVGAAGLLVGLMLPSEDGTKHFMFAYLVAFCFFLSISLGALFFTALHHLTRAGWSVAVRRIAEILSQGLLPLAILFLPILFSVLTGVSSLYPWDNPEIVEHNHKLAGKTVLLNSTGFLIRYAVYFAAWILLARWFFLKSKHQDQTGDVNTTTLMERVAAPTMLIFSLTISAASIDWLMTLDAGWFSTIFGVYYFSGSFMACFAMMILAVFLFQKLGMIRVPITVEHRQDLGKWLFAFNCFWAYIAFSQYMLIWYAALPEETAWYVRRQNNGWEYYSLFIIVCHFLIPFLGFMSKWVKRNPNALIFWAVYMLLMHWADLVWIVMPQYSSEAVTFGLVEVCTLVGVGGLWLAGVIKLGWDAPLIPLRDPRLEESLHFHNT